MTKNIAIIGGGISSLILIKSIQKKQKNIPLHISIYEKKPKLLDFFYKYFSEDSNSKSINKVLLKNLEEVKINLNTKLNIENIKQICKDKTDIVFAMGSRENVLPENINYEKSLEVIKEIKNKGDAIKNKTIAIIGCGNVTMDITRGLIKWGAKKVYAFCRSDWKAAKYTNSELEKTVKSCNNNFSIKTALSSPAIAEASGKAKRRDTFLKKFQGKKEGVFSIFFNTKIKEAVFGDGRYKITTTGGDKIEVDRIISATGFTPVDISPYVNIIESMTEKPRVHLMKGGPINEIAREADKLSNLLLYI